MALTYYTTVCKIDSCLLCDMELSLHCDGLEGWAGMGSGREVQEGGDIHILRADSHSCMAEINTTLKQLSAC